MAVGMISSSLVASCVEGVATGIPGGKCVDIGGDPPPDEISELCGGDKGRESGVAAELSNHCY